MTRGFFGVVFALLRALLQLLRRRWLVVVIALLLSLLAYYLLRNPTIEPCWDPPLCTGSGSNK